MRHNTTFAEKERLKKLFSLLQGMVGREKPENRQEHHD
jgi:hypothetical protein